MRTILAFVFLLSAEPALACHHYRSWSYPWPQSCRVTSAAPVHRTWFVEIATPSPTPPAEAEPLLPPEAIMTLNQELRALSTQTLKLQTLGLTTEEKHGD